MPSVAVLPPSPAFAGLSSPTFSTSITEHRSPGHASSHSSVFTEMQNGYASTPRDTVADIKAAAKEQAHRVRGASATSLLRSARDQILHAKASEGEGDLRSALSALTKAVSLTSMFMDTNEVKQEMLPGKKGVLIKELMNFQQVNGILIYIASLIDSCSTERGT